MWLKTTYIEELRTFMGWCFVWEVLSCKGDKRTIITYPTYRKVTKANFEIFTYVPFHLFYLPKRIPISTDRFKYNLIILQFYSILISHLSFSTQALQDCISS